MQILELDDYAIYLGEGAWPHLAQWAGQWPADRKVVICDANTRIYCLPRLREVLEIPEEQVIAVAPGEAHKNLESCRHIWQRMMQLRLDRQALVINLGGGVIGDMGGMCAALFKRGLSFIQVPTTLLAQVDASIGGKLGIDFLSVKNSIGLFANPRAVYIFPEFLASLPVRQLRNGFAEVIKHALLAGAEHWAEVKDTDELGNIDWMALLPRSLEVKRAIVAEDPLEQGLRKLLNFGHTIGHALESVFLTDEDPLLHGEAVAMGMVCESYLAHRHCGLELEVVQDLIRLVSRLYGHREIPSDRLPDMLRLMQNDKKNLGRDIRFSLLEAPGRGRYDVVCSPEEIASGLAFYNGFGLSLFS